MIMMFMGVGAMWTPSDDGEGMLLWNIDFNQLVQIAPKPESTSLSL
jgi:hypothetical protein